MKKIYWLLNLPRTFIIYLLIKRCRFKFNIFKDLERFAYGGRRYKNVYRTFSEVILYDKCFRNVLDFRLKKESYIKAIILRLFFPIKRIWKLADVKSVVDWFVIMGMEQLLLHIRLVRISLCGKGLL